MGVVDRNENHSLMPQKREKLYKFTTHQWVLFKKIQQQSSNFCEPITNSMKFNSLMPEMRL